MQDIMEPFHYINQVPGKDFRGKLIDAFQVLVFLSPLPYVNEKVDLLFCCRHDRKGVVACVHI